MNRATKRPPGAMPGEYVGKGIVSESPRSAFPGNAWTWLS